MKTYRTCQKPIPLAGYENNPLITTYCMRPAGHEAYDEKGKCAESPTEVDKERYK